MADARQEILDRFYFERGACCAGCDWWASLNSMAGECTKRAPTRESNRFAMLNMHGCSMKPSPGAGHIVTPRDHVCGDFKDEFDWTSLPLAYRAKTGALTAGQRGEP